MGGHELYLRSMWKDVGCPSPDRDPNSAKQVLRSIALYPGFKAHSSCKCGSGEQSNEIMLDVIRHYLRSVPEFAENLQKIYLTESTGSAPGLVTFLLLILGGLLLRFDFTFDG